MQLHIARGTEHDLDELEQLYLETSGRMEGMADSAGWRRGIYPLRSHAKSGIERGELFLARLDGQAVASLILSHRPEPAYQTVTWQVDADDTQMLALYTFMVHPDYKGKGIGSAMLDFCTDFGREQGVCSLRLDVFHRNEPAIRLYEKNGFLKMGEIDLGLSAYGLDRFLAYEKLIKKGS